MKHLADIIRGLREDADLDQTEVAKHLGISQQTYSNYERGRYELPVRHLLPLAQFYQVNVEYLLGATEYRGTLEQFTRPFTQDKTVGGLVSDLVSLDVDGRKSAVDYIEYLKAKKPIR